MELVTFSTLQYFPNKFCYTNFASLFSFVSPSSRLLLTTSCSTCTDCIAILASPYSLRSGRGVFLASPCSPCLASVTLPALLSLPRPALPACSCRFACPALLGSPCWHCFAHLSLLTLPCSPRPARLAVVTSICSPCFACVALLASPCQGRFVWVAWLAAPCLCRLARDSRLASACSCGLARIILFVLTLWRTGRLLCWMLYTKASAAESCKCKLWFYFFR